MLLFELSNAQRSYFGLDPIPQHWERVVLKGDAHRAESILYFDGNTIKRYIASNAVAYIEKQYDEPTRGRVMLLPKTAKGKEKKLSESVLEQRQALGVYFSFFAGQLTIGNYTTQTTFYATNWDNDKQSDKPIAEIVEDFIQQSPKDHLEQVNAFKTAKRVNVKYKSGDYFSFKLSRTHYGFGRILLDVNKIRKQGLINANHGLFLLMGPAVAVELFAYASQTKKVAVEVLDRQPRLPADVMMDNLLFYGEYEIIGHREIRDEEYDFPISYGADIKTGETVFLQWGLIHKELPKKAFSKYLAEEGSVRRTNPYGYYSRGFRPAYDGLQVLKTIENGGAYNFDTSGHFMAKYDLRNPGNAQIKRDIFKAFGLHPQKSYFENALLTNTVLPSQVNSLLKG